MSKKPQSAARSGTAPSPTTQGLFQHAVQAHQRGDLVAAVTGYTRVLEVAPRSPDALANLGVALRALGRDEEALKSFEAAVAVDPRYAQGWMNLGVEWQFRGDYARSAEALTRAASLAPTEAGILFNLGITLQSAGDGVGAQRAFERALALAPTHAGALNALGVLAFHAKDYVRARERFEQALAAEPAFVDAQNNLGGVLRMLGMLQLAEQVLRKALAHDPTHAATANNLAIVLQELFRPAEAENVLQPALAAHPQEPRLLASLANSLVQMDRHTEARAAAEQALARDPNHADAWTVLGNVALGEGQFTVAKAAYDRSLQLEPTDMSAHWNRSLACLALNEIPDAWADFEHRLSLPTIVAMRREYPAPLWDGVAPLDGKTLLLTTEQGFGDALQFLRFAAVLKQRVPAARLVLETPEALAALFARAPYLDGVVVVGAAVPAADFQLPLMSLPHRLAIAPGELAPLTPYLAAAATPLGDRVRALPGVKLGLVWGGRKNSTGMAKRSVPLAALEAICMTPGVTAVSLQVGPDAEDLVGLPWRERLVDLGADLTDFAATASAIAACDLVLTIDTSVAHLAGALGASTWVLLHDTHDYRWALAEETCPWYPTMRLFRQVVPGDWTTPLARVEAALRARVEGAVTGVPRASVESDGSDARAGVAAAAGPLVGPNGGAPRTSAAESRAAQLAALNQSAAVGVSTTGPGHVVPTLAVPAAQRRLDGTPRFRLDIPSDRLSAADAAWVEEEIAGGGVDAPARALLEAALGRDDFVLDVDAGWGFRALAAATHPQFAGRVLSLHRSEVEREVCERAARAAGVGDRLTAVVAEVSAAGIRRAVDALPGVSPLSRRLWVLAGSGAAALATRETADMWRRAGRLLGVFWRLPSRRGATLSGDDHGVASWLAAAELVPCGIVFNGRHLALRPWAPEISHGMCLAVPAGMAEELDGRTVGRPAAASAPAVRRSAPTAMAADGRRRLAIGWQVGSATGWGVFGLHLALRCLRRGDVDPIALFEPNLTGLGGAEAGLLTPMAALYAEMARTLAGAPGQALELPFPVLASLGNNLGGGGGLPVLSDRRAGFVFFEDTALTQAALANGRQYRRLFAGSSWNGEVLRGAGLKEVVTLLQGVDLARFTPGPKTGRWGSRFVVFSGGKLEYRKGQDLVLAAFRAFHQRHPDSVLVTAWHNHWPATMAEISTAGHTTGVPALTPRGTADLVGWATRNGVPASAFVDVGLVPHHAFPAIYREADVGLFPNRAEGGTNLVAMEVMASGVPVILSANTGHLDLIGAVDGAPVTDTRCRPLVAQGRCPSTAQFRGTDGWGESSIEEIVAALEEAYTARARMSARAAAARTFMESLGWDGQVDHLLGHLGDLF